MQISEHQHLKMHLLGPFEQVVVRCEGLSFGNYMCIFWLCHPQMSLTNPLMDKSKRVQGDGEFHRSNTRGTSDHFDPCTEYPETQAVI